MTKVIFLIFILLSSCGRITQRDVMDIEAYNKQQWLIHCPENAEKVEYDNNKWGSFYIDGKKYLMYFESGASDCMEIVKL